jgi:hypothetical protein
MFTLRDRRTREAIREYADFEKAQRGGMWAFSGHKGEGVEIVDEQGHALWAAVPTIRS